MLATEDDIVSLLVVWVLDELYHNIFGRLDL